MSFWDLGRRERLFMRGDVELELRNADGSVAHRVHCRNLITQLGDALVADAMSDRGTTLPTHMAVGSGTGQTSASTTLATELARVALTSTTQGTGGDDNTVVYVATFAAGTGTGTISECALFNAFTSGTMFNYLDTFSSFSKGSGQSLTVTLTVRFGAS